MNNDLRKGFKTTKKICIKKIEINAETNETSQEAFLASKLIPFDKNLHLRPIAVAEASQWITGKVAKQIVTTDEFSVKSQKLLQGLVSHELPAYLSIFNLFKLNELWPHYQKHVNQIILNRTTL